MINFEFEKKKHQKEYDDEKLLLKTYGLQAAREIKKCLQGFRAFLNLGQMLATRFRGCHQLKGDLFEMFAMNTKQPYRMIFKPKPPVPRKEDNGIDVDKVADVIIVEMNKDYH